MFDIDSPFSMVVMIVLIAVGARVIIQYLKLQSSRQSQVTNDDLDTLRSEVSTLKERVKTLEKIVTDKDNALAREISGL